MEYRDIEIRRFNTGSITLEAAIFLTMFILFFLALMDLVQIARAQVVLQYSINEVAKEVSQCSYILTKTGIVEKRLSTASQANEFENQTSSLVDAINQLGETLTSGGDVIGVASNAVSQTQSYFGDSDQLISNILSYVKTFAADEVSNLVLQELVQADVERQIEMMSGKSGDEYLKALGIEGGLAGLDFSNSKWAKESSSDMPELEVVVVYTIDYNLGFLELEPRTFKLSAKTALW